MGLGRTMGTEDAVRKDDLLAVDSVKLQANARAIIARLERGVDIHGDPLPRDTNGALCPDGQELLVMMRRRLALLDRDTQDPDLWRNVPTGWTAILQLTRTHTLIVRHAKPSTIGTVKCKCGKAGYLKVGVHVRPIYAVESGARTRNGAVQPAKLTAYVEHHPGWFVCSHACLSANTQYKQDRPDKSAYPMVAFRRDPTSSQSFTEPRHVRGKDARRSNVVREDAGTPTKHPGPKPAAMPYVSETGVAMVSRS